jgi:hypothetical protein
VLFGSSSTNVEGFVEVTVAGQLHVRLESDPRAAR